MWNSCGTLLTTRKIPIWIFIRVLKNNRTQFTTFTAIFLEPLSPRSTPVAHYLWILLSYYHNIYFSLSINSTLCPVSYIAYYMLLYLLIVFSIFYHTNAHGIIMDFTLNTIIGDDECNDFANFVMRSCFFLNRANNKRLSLKRSFEKNKATQTEMDEEDSETCLHEQQHGDEVCVVSFQKKISKKRNEWRFP